MGRPQKYELSQLISFIEKGYSSKEIAEKLGCTTGSISNFFYYHLPEQYKELLSINTKNKYMKETKTYVETFNIDFDKELKTGRSIKSLSDTYGISAPTLRKYLKKFRSDIFEGFTLNASFNKGSLCRKLSEDQISDILNLSKSGLGLDAIAKRFNIDSGSVRYQLKKNLSEEEYHKRHSVDRYLNNNGWNGKNLYYKEVRYQSHAEIVIAKKLDELNLDFEAHPHLSVRGKRYYPDFYIPSLKLFIEYAGMLSQTFYRRKFFMKLNAYSMGNIKCLYLGEENLEDLPSLLFNREEVK